MFRGWDLLFSAELQTCAQPAKTRNDPTEKFHTLLPLSNDQITLVSSRETSREEAELGMVAFGVEPSLLSSCICSLRRFNIEKTSSQGMYGHLLLVNLFPREVLRHACFCAALETICLRDVPVFTNWLIDQLITLQLNDC